MTGRMDQRVGTGLGPDPRRRLDVPFAGQGRGRSQSPSPRPRDPGTTIGPSEEGPQDMDRMIRASSTAEAASKAQVAMPGRLEGRYTPAPNRTSDFRPPKGTSVGKSG
jgi:hypothetical protein